MMVWLSDSSCSPTQRIETNWNVGKDDFFGRKDSGRHFTAWLALRHWENQIVHAHTATWISIRLWHTLSPVQHLRNNKKPRQTKSSQLQVKHRNFLTFFVVDRRCPILNAYSLPDMSATSNMNVMNGFSDSRRAHYQHWTRGLSHFPTDVNIYKTQFFFACPEGWLTFNNVFSLSIIVVALLFLVPFLSQPNLTQMRFFSFFLHCCYDD